MKHLASIKNLERDMKETTLNRVELAYKEGMLEIVGRVGLNSWQRHVIEVWWKNTCVEKGNIRWDIVGSLNEEMVTHVVNWLLGDPEAFDSIPVDRVSLLKRLKKKMLSGTLPIVSAQKI